MIAIPFFMILTLPFLIVSSLLTHLFLVKRHKELSFYKLCSITLLLGIPLQASVVWFVIVSDAISIIGRNVMSLGSFFFSFLIPVLIAYAMQYINRKSIN